MVSKLSAEAKYRAMTLASSWLKILLNELGFMHKGPMAPHFDSDFAQLFATNPVCYERIKQFEAYVHFIIGKIASKDIGVLYVHTNELQISSPKLFQEKNYLNCYPSWA